MPGPLNELSEVRFALSKEALKMMSRPYLLFRRTNSVATVSSRAALSMTQGPAIITGFIGMFYFYAKIRFSLQLTAGMAF